MEGMELVIIAVAALAGFALAWSLCAGVRRLEAAVFNAQIAPLQQEVRTHSELHLLRVGIDTTTAFAPARRRLAVT